MLHISDKETEDAVNAILDAGSNTEADGCKICGAPVEGKARYCAECKKEKAA